MLINSEVVSLVRSTVRSCFSAISIHSRYGSSPREMMSAGMSYWNSWVKGVPPFLGGPPLQIGGLHQADYLEPFLPEIVKEAGELPGPAG